MNAKQETKKLVNDAITSAQNVAGFDAVLGVVLRFIIKRLMIRIVNLEKEVAKLKKELKNIENISKTH